MDGLSRAVGVGPTMELCGQTFSVKGRVIRSYAEIEAEIIRVRGNPFDYLIHIKDTISGMDSKDSEGLMRVAIQEGYKEAKKWRYVSGGEIAEWMNETFRGQCFMVWMCIRHNNREVLTLEKVTELYCDELEAAASSTGEDGRDKKKEEIFSAIDQASGDDQLGNSTGLGDGAKAVPETVIE